MIEELKQSLASRLNVPVERIGVAHITEPRKLSSTEVEPGDVVIYLKPDDVINMKDLKEDCICGLILVKQADDYSCPVHPTVRRSTPHERMDFEKKFDEQIARSKKED